MTAAAVHHGCTMLECLSPRESGSVPRQGNPARHFLLSENGGTGKPGRVHFLSLPVDVAAGQTSTWVTVTRTGSFTDPRYGRFEITPAMLSQMVANFDARVLGQDLAIDVAHSPDDGAAGYVRKLAVEGTRLRALVEWTAYGVEAVRGRGFRYLSAEYHEDWHDNEAGHPHGCTLLAAGLTTRPVVKHLEPVLLAQADAGDDAIKRAIHPTLIRLLTQENTVNKHLQALLQKLLSAGLTQAQAQPIIDAAQRTLSADADAAADDTKCLAALQPFDAAGTELAKQLKALSAVGTPAPQSITLQMGGTLDQTVLAREVTRLLSEREAAATSAAAAAATQLGAKHRLLSETVGAAKALSDEARTAIVDALKPLVTAALGDDQVKALAELQVSNHLQLSAAQQLATLGYRAPSGSVHITVDSGNQVKALQEQVDKRLGFVGMPDAQRYARTGGTLLSVNKAFAEKALAQFDTERGEMLAREHKMLAGGYGQTPDVGVPAIFERTVLRESLYQLVGLNFVQSGTIPFAAVAQIPYSYRDTTAAGVDALRVFEGQPIRRAGIIQTSEEARPVPQKLAFKLTNEMRYLLGGAPIDFDPLAENTRNVIRIVGEDTDSIVQNEIVRANDEAYSATITDTLTAQVNGTNKVFVLTQFPVVRPRRVYDLRGNLVGSATNALVVTLNGTARAEYTPGTAMAAGTYWMLDYNLGELRFFNEAGVLQTPASAQALTVAYTYTLNVARVNLDIGAAPDTLGAVYDRVLNHIGARKVVMESERFRAANMMLMSGAVDNALSQATTFEANSQRSGTALTGDGSVGQVKGIPVFNTRAPGLYTGDTRVIIGESMNTRFRMMRAFSMNNLEEARDANGLFVGAKENYGEQFVVCMTPSQLKNSTTSLVLYSAAARVARAA